MFKVRFSKRAFCSVFVWVRVSSMARKGSLTAATSLGATFRGIGNSVRALPDRKDWTFARRGFWKILLEMIACVWGLSAAATATLEAEENDLADRTLPRSSCNWNALAWFKRALSGFRPHQVMQLERSGWDSDSSARQCWMGVLYRFFPQGTHSGRAISQHWTIKQRRFFAFAMRAMTLLSITLIKYQIITHTDRRAMLLSCFWLRFQHFSTCMIFACLPHEEVNVQLHAVWLHRSLHRKSWAFICECAARILFLFVVAFVVFPLQRFEIWPPDENWLSERYVSSLQGWSIRTLSWTFRGPVKARQFHIPFGEPAADEEAARAKQMTSRTLTKARYSFFLSCWRG